MNNYNETNQQQTNNVNPAQVQNYITWINSHLKKRPGVKLVENLHSDITNGVPLIHLIEVISGDVLADVNLNPKNHHDYKENIDKVLKFMQLNSVKIARTTSKEILDGNLKSIMRVILALAAHFKPSNLQSAPNHSSTRSNPSIMGSGISSTTSLSSNKLLNNNNNNNNQLNSKSRTLSNIDSMTHLVQAACVSFADVRRYKNENFNVKYVRRNNLLQNGQSNQETLAQSNRIDLPPPVPPKISNNKMFSNSCVNINNNNNYNNKTPVLNNNEDAYPTFYQRAIASSTMISQTKNIDDQTFVIEKKENNNNNMTTQTDLDLNKVESVTQLDVPEILDDVQNLKNALLKLQKLFMNGDRKCFEEVGVAVEQEEEEEENNKLINNGDLNSSENEFVLENLSKDEQIAILRSKIQQLEIVSNDLRNELNETKSESMNNYGMQSGLRARLTELDQNLIDMKNEHINLQLHNQQLLKEKEKYITLFDLNTIEMNKLKADLCLHDETIDKLKMEMNSLLKTDLLRKQIKNIADIEEIKEKESVISGLIANRKLCIIDSKLAGSTSNNNNNNKKSDTTFTVKKNNNSITDEEKNSIKDTLNQLRHNFKPSHPSLFLIDTLEQNILAICERSHHQEIEPDIDLANYKSSKVKYSIQPTQPPPPPPSSIGLITSSTSSINSSTSSSSSSNSSSSANSPILSNNVYTLTTQQHHHQQLQTPFQRYLAPSTTITSNNNNASLKRIEIKTVNKNNEIELPIVNNSEQTNVKKIISRLLSQTNNSSTGLASTATSTTTTTTKKKNDADMMYPSSSSSLLSGIQTISKSSHLGVNTNMLLTISPNSSTTPNTISSPSSIHSPTSSSSSSSSISNLNSLTKCIYYKNNEPNPYSTTVFKSINKVTLYDFKERISKQLDINKHFKFFFKSQDPEFGYLKEEIKNDKTILPTFDNQIVAYIVEIE